MSFHLESLEGMRLFFWYAFSGIKSVLYFIVSLFVVAMRDVWLSLGFMYLLDTPNLTPP